MLLSEMREKYDTLGVFQSWITVDEAFESELMPLEYKGHIPTHCKCGSEIMISKSLRQLTCADPRCYIKKYMTLAHIIKAYGIRDIGAETCREFYACIERRDSYVVAQGGEPTFKTDSAIEFLTLNYLQFPSEFTGRQSASDMYGAITTILNTPLTFAAFVSKLGIPGLETKALSLFEGIDSVPQWLDILKRENGLLPFCRNRGIKSTEVAFWINVFKTDIILGYTLIAKNLKRSSLTKLDVVLTGRMKFNGSNCSKAEFLRACNLACTLPNGTQLIEVRDTDAVKTVNYIVYGVPTNDSNQVIGRNRGKRVDFDGEERDVLINCDEFYKVVKARVEVIKRQLGIEQIEEKDIDIIDLNNNSIDDGEREDELLCKMNSFQT